MDKWHINGKEGDSVIYIGESLRNAGRYLPPGNTVVITDVNVSKFYREAFPEAPVITIPTGESVKTLATLETIYRELIALEADRKTFILGIGGGIVCDIAGFAAATYLRGLRFGFVSTTLLSQVDASVGGKNGVNFDAYKNMIGVFRQPEFVICDTALLHTLPAAEVANGFAEIVKHALIADSELFDYIETHTEPALQLDRDTIRHLVTACVRIKTHTVQMDETEAGERRALNFGHTIGHAIEKTAGVPHGYAVSMGMVAACAFSRERGMFSSAEARRVSDLLGALNLPVFRKFESEQIIRAVRGDKKREGDFLHFVFLTGIGSRRIEKISFDTLTDFLERFFR